MQTNLLYRQAMDAVKKGQKAKARQLLDNLVVQELRNEAAWQLLAEVVENRNEQIDCLVQVIRINPQNKLALEKLRQLSPQSIPQPAPQAEAQELSASAGVSLTNEQIQIPKDIDIQWLDRNQASAEAIKPDINNVRRLVKLDPCNEDAWFQLSKLVSDPAEAADCLRHVLAINPYHTVAKMRLAQLPK